MKNSTAIVDEPATMYETGNDLSVDCRIGLIQLMNERLASAIDLQMQMKQAHWNVKGPNFIGLHTLFDDVYKTVERSVDLIAERIAQLGGVAQGTVRSSAANSRLAEYPHAIADGRAHVEAVVSALSSFGREVRGMINEAAELNDAGSADLFTEVSRAVDKSLWFVESHLQASR